MTIPESLIIAVLVFSYSSAQVSAQAQVRRPSCCIPVGPPRYVPVRPQIIVPVVPVVPVQPIQPIQYVPVEPWMYRQHYATPLRDLFFGRSRVVWVPVQQSPGSQP